MLKIQNNNLLELYNSWKNRTRPSTRWKMTGDITGRMDWLVETFTGVDSITEFGPFQGCSTSAWLVCGPKKIVTVDVNINLDIDQYTKIASELGIDFKFIHSSDLDIDIEETDLLFIDTMHTEEHTFLELDKHAGKVKKYLAFHDVNPVRFSTQAGIDRYLSNNPNQWKVLYHDINDCGFLVLERI